MNQMTELGKILKKLRIDNNETQIEMAKKLGCSSVFISKIEHGLKNMPNEMLENIIKLYSFTDDEKADFKRLVFKYNNCKIADLSGLSDDEVNFILDYIWDKKKRLNESLG